MFKISQKTIKTITKAAIFIFVLMVFNPIVFIQSHERGLKFTMGAISNKILDNGIHFKVPYIQKIESVSVRPIQKDNKIEVDKDGAITKDNQTIGATMIIFYVYQQDNLVKMWKDYGEDKIASLVTSATKESFKSTIGTFTIFELPFTQEKTRNKTLKAIKKKLAIYPIDITEFRITNYDWSGEFDTQIQNTMKKAQEVKQKEQEVKIAELEAQKSVKQAEATKQSNITIAEGNKIATQLAAEAKVLEGEGLRKYNESIRATQDIEIKLRQLNIEMCKIEKWNGVYVANNNYGPIPIQNGYIQGK
jgi:regulator of protease activity HflC (stomatin/prohibitin superfamily)